MGAGATAAAAALTAGVREADDDQLNQFMQLLDPAELSRLEAAASQAAAASRAAKSTQPAPALDLGDLSRDPAKARKQMLEVANVACRLRPEQLEQVMEGYDPNQELTKEGFSELWTKLGFCPDLTDGFYNAIDTDGSGRVNCKELMAGLATASGAEPSLSAGLIMQVYDSDQSGFLSRSEFKAAVVTAFKIMRAGAESAIISVVDLVWDGYRAQQAQETNDATNDVSAGDGINTKEDLVAMMMKQFDEDLCPPEESDVEEMFKQIDADDDERLSRIEVETLLALGDEGTTIIFQPNLAAKKMAESIEEEWAQNMVSGCSVM